MYDKTQYNIVISLQLIKINEKKRKSEKKRKKEKYKESVKNS